MLGTQEAVFRFGDVEVRERDFRLIKAGEVIPVEPKAFRVLLFLLHNPQKLITKEELLNAVWGETAVSENSLTRSVALLRRLLGEDSHEPKFIETVATVGYRFVCPVEVSEDTHGGLESPNSANVGNGSELQQAGTKTAGIAINAHPRSSRRLMWSAIGSAMFFCVLAAAFWYLHRPLPPPHITDFVQITHDGHGGSISGTDGSRVYFAGGSPFVFRQVATTGGETAPVPMEIPGRDVYVLDVSQDGANLLISQLVPDSTSNPLWNVRILGGSVRRLGGTFFAASFSPAGNWVAYVPMRHEIWLVRSDGTGAHKLISVKGYPNSVSWSPDGSTIRFFSNLGIWEVSVNGSNLRQLLPGWRASSEKCCGRWTADGKFYVFIVGKTVSWDPGTVIMGGTQIWALDERRGLFRKAPVEPVQLTSGPIVWGTPVPSKDGKKIFADGRTLRGELSRYDSHSKRFEPFLGAISAEFLDFSKDGKSVAYVSFPEGILWRADRDGRNRVQLTEPPIYPLNPRWSPDGKQILFFAASQQRVPQIYTIPSEGGSPTRLLPEDDGSQTDPNWSPDGRQIVYCCGPPGGREGTRHLNILDLANHKVVPIPGSGYWSPRWSPDGRYLSALGPEQPMLRIFEFKTERWSTIPLKGDVGWPTWSADSKFIYCMWNGSVFRIRVPGGMAERVVGLKDFPGAGYFGGAALAFDPTDAPVMLRNRGSSDIYALTLEEK